MVKVAAVEKVGIERIPMNSSGDRNVKNFPVPKTATVYLNV